MYNKIEEYRISCHRTKIEKAESNEALYGGAVAAMDTMDIP